MDEKTFETVMTAVCSTCHWPYVETDQEALDDRCMNCSVECAIRAALEVGHE